MIQAETLTIKAPASSGFLGQGLRVGFDDSRRYKVLSLGERRRLGFEGSGFCVGRTFALCIRPSMRTADMPPEDEEDVSDCSHGSWKTYLATLEKADVEAGIITNTLLCGF